ncbi:hypothetical protein TIFTF001_052744 [Ficus carica]|uniref:Uncharacterized protein n=1 Tax=Ficus carica TaxID=3494 RepID=A0AA88EC23_FICCA|nr:hypothetical protein TIFTF001_052744 [Ficus carica]
MLNSAFPASLGAQVTLVGRILSGLDISTSARGKYCVSLVRRRRLAPRQEQGQVRDDVVGTAQGRPPRWGFSHGRGSVSRADTMGPHSDMLEIHKGELLQEAAQWWWW